jgi:hypothetical protein
MSIVPLRNKQAGDALFHQELWSTDDYNSELDGVGWCGVDSRHRVIKAIFLNGPQLILVSFYGQYYYYIHQYVDPAKELDVSGALGQTKITTSRNAGMMSSKQQLRAASIANASQQQRLYMVPYMVSFLLNTLLQLFSDNLSSGPPSTFNLALQAVTVTPQGFLIGLVYMRSSKNIFTLYAELIESLLAERSPHKVSKWKEKRYKLQMKREKLTAFRKAQTDKMFSAGSDHGVSIGGLLQIIWITWNTALFTPLAVWVWTPMEFLGEFLRTKVQILMGLCVWGVILVLPTYWFSLGRLADLMCLKTFAIAWADDDGVVHWPTNPAEKYTTGGGGDACIVWYEGFAEWYIVMLIFVSSVAVYKNRYSPRLLFTEGPVRREGFLAKIGMGMRLNSIRNSMGCFTMSLEFYQIWGLTWTASQMDVLYFDKSDNITEAVDFQYNYTNVTSSYNVSTGRSYGFEHWDPEQFLLSKGLSPDDRTIFEKNELLKFWVCVGMVGGWTFLYCLPHVITTTTVGNRALVFNLMEAYRGYLWFMAGAGFLTILKALVKMTFCRPHPEVPDLAGPLVAYTDYSIPCWSPEHLRYVVISLGCLCVFFPSASLTCLFRYDDDDDRGFGPRKWRSGIAGELSEEGTHIKHRPIYAHNHKRDYPVAPCLRGCVLGGEDLRWLHLWRRIEYMVKFCWVFAGYRLSQHANAVAVVLLLGSFIIAFVNARMHPSNLQYVNLWKLEIHVANVWTTMTCLYANAVGFTNENEHWIVLVSGWVILTAGLVGWEARVVANDVFLLDCSSEHPNGKRNQNRCKREARMLRRNIAYNTGTKRWATHRHITRLFRLCEHKDLTVSRAAFKEVATLAYQDQMTGTLPLPDERGMPIKGFHETNSFFLCLTPTDPWTMTMIHAITTSPDMDIRHYATQVLTAFLQMNIGNKVFAPTTFHETLVRYDQSTWDKSALGFLTNNLPHNLPDRVEGQITRDIANYAVDKYDVAGTRRASGTNSNLSAAQLIMEMCNADSNKLIVVADTMLPMLTAWLDKGSIIQQYTAVHLIAMVSNRFDLANKVINSGALASVINLFKAVHSVYGQFVDAGAEIQDDNPAKFDESRANVPSIRFDKPMPGKISVSGRQLSKGMKKLDDFMTERLPPMSAPVETQADDDESAESAVDDVGIPNEFVLDGKMLTMIQGDILHDCIQTVVELAGASRAVGRRLILEAGATDVVTTCLHFAAPQVAGVDAGIELRVHDDLLHEALRACHAFLSGRFSMEDIEFDDDFHKPYVFLIKWKETVLENEDWDAEVEVGAYLTATQRRKAHIICAFLQLEHESVGGIGKRKVMARLSEKLKPKSPSRERESMDDMNDSPKPVAVTPTSDKPQWLIEHEKGPQDNDAEDEIYAWCWTTMEATGALLGRVYTGIESKSGSSDAPLFCHTSRCGTASHGTRRARWRRSYTSLSLGRYSPKISGARSG